MLKLPSAGHDARVNTLICCGHTLSHFYILMMPTMFLAWQQAFGVSFAELGISVAVMSGTTAIVQTPIGFLVDRYGARRFLIGGTLLMTLSVSLMGLATSFWLLHAGLMAGAAAVLLLAKFLVGRILAPAYTEAEASAAR